MNSSQNVKICKCKFGDLGGEVITITNASSYIYGVYTALSTVAREEASFTFYNGVERPVYGDLRNAPFGPGKVFRY